MAKKDTLKALVRRDISEEVATLLVNKFDNMGAICEAGIKGIVDAGVDENQAQFVLEKIGSSTRSATRRTTTSKPKKDESDVEVKFEPVPFRRARPVSETETRLLAIADRAGIDVPNALPLKTVVDIAEKIEHADLDDDTCLKLLERASEIYTKRLMDLNESVGVMAAHSIGEPATQMNLRTFHVAGDTVVSVTRGLPRLLEIVDARSSPATPSMMIPLLGLARTDEGVAKTIASRIVSTTLTNVATIEYDANLLTITIRPDEKSLEMRNLTFDKLFDRVSKTSVLRGLKVVREDGQIVVTLDEPSFIKLQRVYENLCEVKVGGIDGITSAKVHKDKSKQFFVIETEGSNLKEIFKMDLVDTANVKTNSVCEIAEVLGIEAARNAIVNEAVFTLNEDAGLGVDVRHLMLVADAMTNSGSVRSIGRNGISGSKSSTLARAAFELVTPNLVLSATIGGVDNLEGVSENIIVGQPVTLGTGAVNLKYTPKKKGENE